ncbi:MAG: UbiA family prenyltransferase [Chitinophagales bacterium]|nr:UbiA family prenyltransferase [Chitinophagales bacterium]
MVNPFSYIRTTHWWAYKATPVLGFIYFYCNYAYIPNTQLFSVIFSFLISFVGFAGLGYVINDIYDIRTDRKAKKSNSLDGTSFGFKVGLQLFLSILAWSPWIYLRMPWYIILCLLGLLGFLLLYSHPYTRFKEHPLLGPMCDALYGHVIPILITCFTFQQYIEVVPYNEWAFYISLIIWQFLKGLRNIFIHQIDDFENDNVSNTRTLVTLKGKEVIYRFAMRRILPLEIVFLFIFLISVGPKFKGAWLFFCLFILIYRIGHGKFKKLFDHQDNYYLFFLNDFYEMYLPYYFLLSFCFRQPVFILFLLVHILMFPNISKRVKTDVLTAIFELKNFVKDFLYTKLRQTKR